MNCETASELAAAYALGALEPAAARAFEEHLAGCARHDEELAAHRRVTAGLARAADPIAPPSGLRDRLLAAAEAERPPAQRPSRPIEFPVERARERGPRFSISWAVAAAFGVIALGLAVWNVSLLSDDDAGPVGPTEYAFAGTGGAGEVTRVPGSNLVVVELRDLQNLAADQDYQVWAIAGGEPQSLGVLRVQDGVAILAGEATGSIEAVAVTIEPAGGSPLPTSDPILTAPL
jgi:anti-sigma-K factor RskA